MAKELINGIELYYETKGDNGDWVILLNGIAMTAANWNPVSELLGKKYRILTHDFRGQLLSEKPAEGYSLKGHADDLHELMKRLGIDRAHVVGTSYGGEVAIEFALSYPVMTMSLSIIDSVSELDPLLTAAVESWKAAALLDPVTFYRVILPWNYSAAYLKNHREDLARRESAVSAFPPVWFSAFCSMCDAFLEIDQTSRLGAINCQTLVITGGEDILKEERFAQIIAGAIRKAKRTVIAGAGHAVVIERPDAVADVLTTFLGGIE